MQNHFQYKIDNTPHVFITTGEVLLDIAFEDTRYQDEIWIFDFQPYEFNGVKPVVTDGFGSIVAEYTGSCSSVFHDHDFDVSILMNSVCKHFNGFSVFQL